MSNVGISRRESAEGKGVPGDSSERREGARANGGQFGVWNSESQSVGGGTESAGRGVELKAVGQVGGSRVMDPLIAEGSNLVLNSLRDREPVE